MTETAHTVYQIDNCFCPFTGYERKVFTPRQPNQTGVFAVCELSFRELRHCCGQRCPKTELAVTPTADSAEIYHGGCTQLIPDAQLTINQAAFREQILELLKRQQPAE